MDAVQGPFAITEGRGGYPLQAGASGGEEEEKAREAREMREPEAAVTTSGGPRSAGSADEARTWHGGAAPRTLELESSLVPPDVWRPSPAPRPPALVTLSQKRRIYTKAADCIASTCAAPCNAPEISQAYS